MSSLKTEHEAAALLNIPVKTLQQWRWAGKGLPFVKLGRLVRYELAALEAYIKQQTRHSTSEEKGGAI